MLGKNYECVIMHVTKRTLTSAKNAPDSLGSSRRSLDPSLDLSGKVKRRKRRKGIGERTDEGRRYRRGGRKEV